MYLKYNNDNTYYKIEYLPYFDNDNNIVVQNTKYNIPQVDGGFSIYDDYYNLIADYNEYKYFYNQEDDYIVYTSDEKIYYIYMILDVNKIVKACILTSDIQPEDEFMVLYISGRTKECKKYNINILDDDKIYKYKFVENQLIELKEEEKLQFKHQNEYNSFIRLKESKIKELSETCERQIINGIEYNEKHFSYTLADQNNLYNAFQLSQNTGLSVPYHADDEPCELYSKEDIFCIYVAQQTNLTHHSTYFNQLKLFVNSLETKEEVDNVYYGQELSGIYLETYNIIMMQSQEITNSFINQIGE